MSAMEMLQRIAQDTGYAIVVSDHYNRATGACNTIKSDLSSPGLRHSAFLRYEGYENLLVQYTRGLLNMNSPVELDVRRKRV